MTRSAPDSVLTAPREAPDHLRDISTMARGGSLNLVGAFSFAVLGFVLLFVLTRGYGAATTGAFLEAVALFNIAATFSTLGVDTGLIWAIPRAGGIDRRLDIRRMLRIALGPVTLVGAATAGLLVVMADPIARAVTNGGHEQEVATFIRAMGPLVPVAALHFAVLAATRGLGTMRPTVLLDKVTRAALQPLGVFVALASGVGALLLALSWASAFVVSLVLGGVWLGRLVSRVNPKWSGDSSISDGEVATPSPSAVDFWRFTLPRTLASVFYIVVQWFDVLLVGGIASTREAGIYVVATRLLQFGNFVTGAVGQVAQPLFSQFFAQNNVGRAESVWRVAAGWQMILVWPLLLACAVFARSALQLFGDEFVEGAVALSILAIARMPGVLFGPVSMVLLMGGRSTWALYNQIGSLATNILLNILLIPRYGLTGAALAWGASSLFINVMPLLQVHRFMGINPFAPQLVYPAIASLICYGVVGLVIESAIGPSFVSLIVGVTVTTAIYAALILPRRKQLALDEAWRSLRRRARGGGGGRRRRNQAVRPKDLVDPVGREHGR